jgi:predicted AlkP superfamily pyrophosphatase or phosphodiesterase
MLRKRFFFFAMVLAWLSVPLHAEKIKHVIIVSVDGLRPDAISDNNSPTIQMLKKNGFWANQAKTITPSITLPSHTSMLTGRGMEVHKITWNDYDEAKKDALKIPTCLELANRQNFSAAMFVGKEKFRHLQSSNASFYFAWPSNEADGITQAVLAYEKENKLPGLMFIHYPDTDTAGHQYGWMSHQYFLALKKIDNSLLSIVNLINQKTYQKKTVIILTADHGGKDKTHGRNIPEDMHIPWMANGSMIQAGFVYEKPVTTYDTAATALSLLGVPIPLEWEGKALVLPIKSKT